MTDVTQWLYPDEAEIFQTAIDLNSKPSIRAFESLAECRRLMKKHKWDYDEQSGRFSCVCCGRTKEFNCESDCAWDKAITGLPRIEEEK